MAVNGENPRAEFRSRSPEYMVLGLKKEFARRAQRLCSIPKISLLVAYNKHKSGSIASHVVKMGMSRPCLWWNVHDGLFVLFPFLLLLCRFRIWF